MLLLFLILQYIPEIDDMDMDMDMDMDFADDPQPPRMNDALDDVDERLRRGDGQPRQNQGPGDGTMANEIEERKRQFREQRVSVRGERRRVEMGKVECTKPHTHRAAGTATCVCDDGYVGSDPEYQGCWKCEPECHEQALCQEGGKCRCAPGYVGDGVKNCEYDYPEIERAWPTLCTHQPCVINISLMPGHLTDEKAFCVFDGQTVEARRIRGNVWQCKAPATTEWKLPMVFTWDGSHLSREVTIYFTKLLEFDDDKLIVFGLFAAMLVSGWLVWRKRRLAAEQEPLVVRKAKGTRRKPKKSQYETL